MIYSEVSKHIIKGTEEVVECYLYGRNAQVRFVEFQDADK